MAGIQRRKLKFREVQLDRVYCICILWFFRFIWSSFFSVPLVQIWSRKFDLRHVIVSDRGDGDHCICSVAFSGAHRAYWNMQISACAAQSPHSRCFTICAITLTFIGCQGSKTHNSVVFLCKIEIQFIFISSTKRTRLETESSSNNRWRHVHPSQKLNEWCPLSESWCNLFLDNFSSVSIWFSAAVWKQ